MSVDYRQSAVERKRSWYGLKRPVKRLLALRIPHIAMRVFATHVRPELARGGRLPAPAHLREVRGEVLGKTFVMVRPDSCEIAKELYWGRGKRPRAADAYAVELFARLAQVSDMALDIGAYTGIFTIVAARVNPNIRVHAFEIVPDVFEALLDNCVRNDLVTQVTLHLEGVGAAGDSMRIPARTRGSALPSYYSRSLTFRQGVRVPFISLDSLLEGLVPANGRILIKVDVEGTEAQILEDGQSFLAARRPDILCEVLPNANGALLQALLEPHGYRFILITGERLIARARIEPDVRFRDWLFTTKDARELAQLGIET